jgi:hypothetical protein
MNAPLSIRRSVRFVEMPPNPNEVRRRKITGGWGSPEQSTVGRTNTRCPAVGVRPYPQIYPRKHVLLGIPTIL